MLFITVSYITFNFKLRIDPKCFLKKTYKKFGNLEKIRKKLMATLSNKYFIFRY